MKTKIDRFTARIAAFAVAALMLTLLAGCFEKRFQWSPDGTRAAVLTDGGFHLCDADGKLSPLLLPQVYRMAWMSDSQRLVLATQRDVGDWATFERALGPERAAAVAAEAEALWRKLEEGGIWSVLTMDLGDRKHLVKICLRERHGTALRAKLDPGAWHALEAQTGRMSELLVARIDGERLVREGALFAGPGDIADIRVAPGDRVVAFTVEMEPEADALQLMVVPSDGTQAPAVVARNVAWYPDWTADGRHLVAFEAAGPAASKDELRLGVLAWREVLDAEGRIRIAEKPDFLAGAIFGDMIRVRCLRDGRILFNAAEVSLPLAAGDYGDQREQLFAVDPARQATLVRLIPRKGEAALPQQLAFFEVSPDETRIVFGGMKGEVCQLTLATGEVEQVQSATKHDLQGAPVWRRTGELTYLKRNPAQEGKPPARAVEVVLLHGETETVISATWPDEVIKQMTGDR